MPVAVSPADTCNDFTMHPPRVPACFRHCGMIREGSSRVWSSRCPSSALPKGFADARGSVKVWLVEAGGGIDQLGIGHE